MSRKAQSTLESMRLAIHGVTAPFSCEGTCVPDKPVTFVFRDRTRFEVIRAKSAFDQKNELKPLLEHCKPAPFGDGKKTRYDRLVRDALQLEAKGGGFSIAGFDPESAGILKKIQRELIPHDLNPISAELYTVNVYTDGGHFAPHKDTPRGNDMFGTLVVCLPSRFWRGHLVLTHRGVVRRYDWGSAIEKQETPNQLHWAAFFGDVDHQIERIGSGARVTLTYLLRRGDGGAPRARQPARTWHHEFKTPGWPCWLTRVSFQTAAFSGIPVAISTIRTHAFRANRARSTSNLQPCSKDAIIWWRRRRFRPD